VQLERVGCDFHGDRMPVERYEITRLARTREAAEDTADRARGHLTAAREEANVVVSMERNSRKHVHLDRASLT
jgi:hypothetical protein